MRYIKATLRERLLDTLRGEVCGAPLTSQSLV